MPKKIPNQTYNNDQSEDAKPQSDWQNGHQPAAQPVKVAAQQTNHMKYAIPGLLVVASLGMFGTVLGYQHYNTARIAYQAAQTHVLALEQNPTVQAQEETQALVNQVGTLVSLPQDEQPTIATVTDLSALKDQPFFADAQVNDKVLIYANAKRAVLYRPSENKVIEIAPLNITQNSGAATPSVLGSSTTATPTPTPSKSAKTKTPSTTPTPTDTSAGQ